MQELRNVRLFSRVPSNSAGEAGRTHHLLVEGMGVVGAPVFVLMSVCIVLASDVTSWVRDSKECVGFYDTPELFPNGSP